MFGFAFPRIQHETLHRRCSQTGITMDDGDFLQATWIRENKQEKQQRNPHIKTNRYAGLFRKKLKASAKKSA